MSKKILFVYKTPRKQIYNLWKQGKGSDTVLYGANHLQKTGYKVDIFDFSFSKANPLRWFMYPVHIFASQKTGMGFNLGQALTLLPLINKYDAIVSTIDSAGLPLLFLKKIGLIRRPIIYMSIDFAFRIINSNTWPFNWYKTLLNYADAVICNYSEEKKILNRFNSNVNFLKIGVDKKYYHNADSNGDKNKVNKILAFGRDRDRDYQTFINALANLKVRGDIVCSKSNLKDIKLNSNIRAFFDLEPRAMKEKISGAQIIVIPIKKVDRSGGHLSLLDSLMSGKPVIVASNKGITKTYNFVNKKDCLFYEPGNAKDLESKIAFLLKDHSLRRKLEINGRKKARLYSTENYAANLDKIIKKITQLP